MPETEVTFPSGATTLAGTYTRPAGDGPVPTALLLSGSGPLDRDSNHKRMRLNVSRDLASLLERAGWASLRFDKRGVGASGGEYLSTGFWEEFADAEAARDWLAARDDVGPLVVVGHSVGASYAAELAGRTPAIDGAVLLAATAKDGEQTLRWQARQIGDNLVPGPVKAIMRLFGTDVLKQQDSAIRKLQATTTDTARIQLSKVNARWMREFIAYDPVPALRAATAPLLAITGSKDVQVDPADLAVIAREAPAATVQEVPDVDHVLRPESAAISNPRHYGRQLKQPIDARVTEALLAWLAERRGAPASAAPEAADAATRTAG